MLEARDEVAKVREVDLARMQQLEHEVREANERAARLKKDRDAYAHRFHEKCAEQPNQATVEELRRLIAAQERELRHLRPELDRLRADAARGVRRTEVEEQLMAQLEDLGKVRDPSVSAVWRAVSMCVYLRVITV